MTREEVLEKYSKGESLRGADLRGANLYGADLRGADLSDAKGLECHFIVPEVGEFHGFKKLANGVIAELLIPAEAARVGGLVGRKCRASKAIVLNGSGPSKFDLNFLYEPGKEISPDVFDPDIRVECSHGIHFFITRKEAEEY